MLEKHKKNEEGTSMKKIQRKKKTQNTKRWFQREEMDKKTGKGKRSFSKTTAT